MTGSVCGRTNTLVNDRRWCLSGWSFPNGRMSRKGRRSRWGVKNVGQNMDAVAVVKG